MPEHECEIRWCRSGEIGNVEVCENIGDGNFSAHICRRCAQVLGTPPGGQLPEPATVERLVKASQMNREQAGKEDGDAR